MCNEAPNSVSWLLISSFGDLGHGNEILMHGFLSLSIFLETCYLCLLALSFGSSQCLFEILVECVCSWLNVLGFRFIGLHDGLNNVGFSVPQVWLCLGRGFFLLSFGFMLGWEMVEGTVPQMGVVSNQADI